MAWPLAGDDDERERERAQAESINNCGAEEEEGERDPAAQLIICIAAPHLVQLFITPASLLHHHHRMPRPEPRTSPDTTDRAVLAASSSVLCSDRRAEMMPQQQSLDLGLSLGGLTSQGSMSSSTTSGQLSPWAAALNSVVGDVRREARQQQQQAADPDQGMMRASTSPDSAAALSSGDSGNNKRERELERTGSGGMRGAGSDEEDGAGGRKKLRLSKDQAAVLEECFKTHSTLNPKQKVALANRLGLRPRQVEVWFQNRRARTKLKQTEVDCEYLKRWCERLADENKRLEKELADLRALKAAPSPAAAALQPSSATLTMCPSCRRVATANQQQQRHHPKSNNGAVAGNVLPSHCQFFPAAVDRTGQSSWNPAAAAAAAAPLVTRELF